MPTYVTLYKFTGQGARDMKTLPQRAREVQANAEQRGFKILGWYLTQGRFDLVTVVEAPDELSTAAVTLDIVSRGNVSTETLRAFTLEETEQIVRQMR